MKVIVTESQYLRVSGEMEEALGVPEGILESGEEIYNTILKELENFKGDIEELSSDGLIIKKEFKIGGHIFNKIKVIFEIEEDPETSVIELEGMYSENMSELSDDIKLKSVRNINEIVIGLRFSVNPNTGIKDIIDYLKLNRKEGIPSLTHELKHTFRDVKEKETSPISRAEYRGVQETRETMGFLSELNEFLFNSYFIHAIENVVRPTELASYMRINNVSKKEFLKFFLDSDIIKRLKKIENFNYDEFKESLLSPKTIKIIKDVFEHNDIDFEGKTDEQLVHEVLRMFLVNLTNQKTSTLNKILTTNLVDQFFGLTGPKDVFFREYLKYATRFGYDYDRFFRNEEKYFNRVATEMIKKLAKLYAMAKDSPSE
jgi:hypothetical protein